MSFQDVTSQGAEGVSRGRDNLAEIIDLRGRMKARGFGSGHVWQPAPNKTGASSEGQHSRHGEQSSAQNESAQAVSRASNNKTAADKQRWAEPETTLTAQSRDSEGDAPAATRPLRDSKSHEAQPENIVPLRSQRSGSHTAVKAAECDAESVVSEQPGLATAQLSAAELATDSAKPRDAESSEAFETGVQLLARKQFSVEELRRELVKRGHDTIDAEAVVYEFVDRLYLNDVTLARNLCASLREKKQASRAEVARQLRQRFVEPQAVETVLSELDEESETELMYAVAEKRARKLSGLDRETAERRLVGFLARRGWNGAEVWQVAKTALEAAGADEREALQLN